MSGTDITHMRHALTLGARGLGQTWPNPAVGCVIVREARIVGRGWTQTGGVPHAETRALAQAGSQARGATAYVTLEPCAHHGRTPPCAEALIAAGIGRVVMAATDPDPQVNGKGAARLRAAGVKVTGGVLEDAARSVNAGFILRVTKGRPMVTLKLAASLDGRIATARGESKWITGRQARRMAHAMRARHDAVMIGGGTARADDPLLTARDMGIAQQPIRIVWTCHLDIPLRGQLAQTAADIPVWILHAESANADLCQAWQGLGARLFACPTVQGGQIDPIAGLNALAEAGLTRVLCEGGGTLAASLMAHGLIDELACFSAGIGLGADAQPMLATLGLVDLAQAPSFTLIETRAVGGDVLSRWRRRPDTSS